MSKYIKPWRPLLFCSAQPTAFTARMPSDHMDTAQPSELACLPQEPQSHNEAQDLLLLQDYVCKLSHTQRTLEDTYALLQQTELLAGVINEQDCRAIRTACCCLKSLRIRVEARANVTERAVIGRQLQLMQASVQHYPTEDLNTADTSCPSRTSAEHRGGPKLRSQSKEQQTVPKTGPPTLAPEPPEQHQPSACSAFCLPAAFAFALGGITCKHATTKQRITNPRLLPCEQNR